MSKYTDSRDLAEKMYSEGGLPELLFGYGLSVRDLPDDLPASVEDALIRLMDSVEDMELVEKYLNKKLPF